MSMFPEHVTVREMTEINSNPDDPIADSRYCKTHDFEGVVEVYRCVLFGQLVEEWRCPGIGGEDAHDVTADIDATDPDAYRDEVDE